MSAYDCEFYGGPLAGQVHMILDPPRVYKVPSFTRLNSCVTDAVGGNAVLFNLLETEEYELGPNRGQHSFSYTWINPATALRKEIVRLREETNNLADALCEAEKFRADALRWRSLTELIADALPMGDRPADE